jgi:dephospho-CoA kinase
VTRVIALTGNVAAGKSTVSSLFASWGAAVIDADKLVRELQQPGEPVFEAIAHRFGPVVVDLEGRLDRRALRRIMLADPGAKRDLEAIVHPAVIEARRGLTQLAADRGESLVWRIFRCCTRRTTRRSTTRSCWSMRQKRFGGNG